MKLIAFLHVSDGATTEGDQNNLCCELIQPNSPVQIVVAVAHGRPRNYANLFTIKVSNSSLLAYGLVYGL